MTTQRRVSRVPWTPGLLVAAGAGLSGWMAARLVAPAALAGAVLVAGAALAARRPALGLGVVVALAILVPFIVVPVRLGAQPPVILILLSVIVAASALAIGRGFRPPWRDRVLAIQGLFIVLIVVATLLAIPIGQDVEALQTGLKLALAATVPFLVVMWVPAQAIRRYGAPLVILAATTQATVAIALHLAGDPGVEFLGALAPAGYPAADVQRFLPDQETARATGLLVDPNVLGATLAISLPFVVVGVLASKRTLLVRTVATALIAAALVLSLSRGAWVGATVGMIVVIAVNRPRLGAALGLAAAALLMPPWPDGPLATVRAAVLERDVSNALRLDELREAARVVGRYPWFGVGYGDAPDVDIFVGVSNTWLWIAERAGILAAVSALGVVATALVHALRAARADPVTRACAAAIAALVVVSMVDQHLASFSHLAALSGALVGATLVLVRRQA